MPNTFRHIAESLQVDIQADKWLDRYDEVRSQTRKLVHPLGPEDQMVQSMPDASPAKWHLAHTTWFFEEFILLPHLPGYACFDSRFSFLFNSYYKQLGPHPHRALRGTFSRPTLDEVCRYRRHVDNAIHELHAGGASAEVLRLTELGLNHEQQHQELIVTDIKHAFWTNPMRPAYQPDMIRLAGASVAHPEPVFWCAFDGGIHEVGRDREGFAFDNERPRHSVHIDPFSIASRLVTNSEYLEFMAAGGYERPELWLSDAWDHVCQNGWSAPLYWEAAETGWREFTCRGMSVLNPDAPVCHVSFYEADAFARWADARLPTEFEWEVAAGSTGHLAESADHPGNMLENGAYHPVSAGPADRLQSRLQQVLGDTWEWTASPYAPYPGYRPPAGAEGEYNGKFMCNQMVLRGGSCVTPRSHIRESYRNFFPPHMRWQFSGIRLAHDGAAS